MLNLTFISWTTMGVFLDQVEHKKLTRLITMMTNKVCIHVLLSFD